MTNFNALLENVPTQVLIDFVNGEISGNQLYSMTRNTEAGGIVRELIRPVSRGRKNTREALRRRKISLS